MAETKAKNRSDAGGDTQTMGFQAEVGRLLHIVTHALYSEREIFLRELVSNAADACDKLRYLAIEKPELTDGQGSFAIDIIADPKEGKAGTIVVSDNGIGMDRDDLVSNLGTIAKSGTSAFLENLTGDAKKDINLIGQFGVGFYSAFMVADKVEVLTRKAGTADAWLWASDGNGEFTIAPSERAGQGTTITLYLKDDAKEFVEDLRLRQIVKTYSDHIPFPIRLTKVEDGKAGEPAQINEGSALWTRQKSEITEDQYKEFYHHVAHAFDDPWAKIHFKAEGMIEYSGLVYIPTERPFDLFHPERLSKLKLYVRRVFITDDCEDLIPKWLRFLRGVVDSSDLPLNVSREMLQNNPVVAKIRSGLTKRVLGELERKAEKEPETYATFWEAFGMVLKEGLYEGTADRETLLKLARFRSTASDGLVSLEEYVSRMKEGQEAIYYIAGEDIDAMKRSPHLEGFEAKGVEVLFMADPVDEFWVPSVEKFNDKPFKSVTRGGADLSSIKGADSTESKAEDKKEEKKDETLDSLIVAMKLALGDKVKDIRTSERLRSSAVCLVADEGTLDMNIERLLRRHKQLSTETTRILEINPDHPLIKAVAGKAGTDGKGDIREEALLLLDQARILEGETPADPAGFARRIADFMTKALAT